MDQNATRNADEAQNAATQTSGPREAEPELEGVDGGYVRVKEVESVAAADGQVAVRYSERPWPRPWMGEFLDVLSLVPVAAQAARNVGLASSTVYWWRSKDASFAEAWREACEQAAGRIDAVGYRWSTVGVEVSETTVHRDNAGRVVTVITTTSTKRNAQIAMMLLKRHRPEYGGRARAEVHDARRTSADARDDPRPMRQRVEEMLAIARSLNSDMAV